MKRRIIIVGGVALGASAATRLRRLNEEDEIILLEKDEYISYANCGLPYYIGDVIKERDDLLAQTVEGMKERFNIDVRIFNEAIKINREKKEVIVKDKQTDEQYKLSYDYLILAPGAKPIVFPIKGYDAATNIFTLRNILDTDKIKAYLLNNDVKQVVIVGGGFIGLEVAENLTNLGIKVIVIDLANQLMKMFDSEMAKLIQNVMESQGVEFRLGVSVTEFKEEGKQIVLSDETILNSDMNIMAIGVLPETKLAKEADLELGESKAIKVNKFNQTSDPFIYAGGDAVEIQHFIAQKPVKIPLAGPANRQARVIADNINGLNSTYHGSLGSAIIKVFDYIAATTGLSEMQAKDFGYEIECLHVQRPNHAGYYPDASNLTIKLIYDKKDKRILGAQAFGKEGTDKRIDVLATAINFKATINQLQDLQLCYAPPFSSAKDPVNIAGDVADNLEEGYYETFYVQDIEKLKGAQLLDVRSKEEYDMGHIEGSRNLSVDVIRNFIDEVDFNKDIYLYCRVGQRAYLAAKILKEHGFKKKIYNLSGGYLLYSEFIK